jgi:hypothetical protein
MVRTARYFLMLAALVRMSRHDWMPCKSSTVPSDSFNSYEPAPAGFLLVGQAWRVARKRNQFGGGGRAGDLEVKRIVAITDAGD